MGLNVSMTNNIATSKLVFTVEVVKCVVFLCICASAILALLEPYATTFSARVTRDVLHLR